MTPASKRDSSFRLVDCAPQVRPSNQRGAVTDEWIAIFKQLWGQSPASFTGEHYSFANIRAEPFPLTYRFIKALVSK